MELQFQLLNTYCTRWYPTTTTKPKKKKHGELYTSTSTCLYYCPSIYFEIKWRVHSSRDSAEWNWKRICNHSFTPVIYNVAVKHDNWFVLSGNAKYVYLREEIFAWIAWDWVWNESWKLIPQNIQSFGLSIPALLSAYMSFIEKHDAWQHQYHFCWGRMARRGNESCFGWPS